MSTTPKKKDQARHPKTDVRYWEEKVFKNSRTRLGERTEDLHFSVKIQFKGRRETFPLATANKKAAGDKSRKIYLSLVATGWEQTLAKWKPRPAASVANLQEGEDLPQELSLGEYLRKARLVSRVTAQSFNVYEGNLRRIVSEVACVEQNGSRRNTMSGGRIAWVEAVEATPLLAITKEKILIWKQDYLARAGDDPVKVRRSKTSVNAIIRNARSLFSREIREFVGLEISPFDGISLEPKQSMRYRGGNLNIPQIVKWAREGCEENQIPALSPEEWKIFLLALMAGLSKKEIDLLEWPSIRKDDGFIRIVATSFYAPKTEDRLGDVDVDMEVIDELLSLKYKATDRFVVESETPPRATSYPSYRCQTLFRSLTSWLRSVGFDSLRPIHQLRKEFGSLICEKDGLFVASRMLRHSNVTTTADYYVDRKARKTVGLGGLLRTV